MKLAIGCDSAGASLLDVVRRVLTERGIEFEDYGVPSDSDEMYPDVAKTVAQRVADGEVDRGVLVCGTGIGMCITANKVPGVRAALCHDTYSAERAQLSNNAQVLTMGGRVIGPLVGEKIVEAWLDSEYVDNERSGGKVRRMNEIDDEYRGLHEA